MAFKMRAGSPMQRNFGIGSPLHDDGPTPDNVQQAPPQGSVDGVAQKNKRGNKPVSPVPQRGDSNTAIAKAESRTASERSPARQRGDSNTAIAKAESRTASERSPAKQSVEPVIEGQPKTYGGTSTSVKSQMNKANRLAGKTISYEDAWQGMSSGVRKSKYDNNFDAFVSDSEEFKKTNSNYEKGSSKYSNFQGKF